MNPNSDNNLVFRRQQLPARFEPFALDAAPEFAATVVVPTVRSTKWLKYGEHAYYFMDFATRQGLCVSLSHSDIIRPGLARFRRAAAATAGGGGSGGLASARALLGKYHYGFSFLEEIMLLTVPHTVTDIGAGVFLINLWAYFAYLRVDCRKRTVTYHILEGDSDTVLGARQWRDSENGDISFMAYSLGESFARIDSPGRGVESSIFRRQNDSPAAARLWTGQMADFMHDFAIGADRRYWAACELGMYRQEDGRIMPSRVLVGATNAGAAAADPVWRLDDINVAAHVQFDPDDGDALYLSSHNFQFVHTPLLKLLRQATYTVKFNGPAAIIKYRIDGDGPRQVGRFSREDFKRLTNMHVFSHRGRKIIAAMGFPDEIFIIDAQSMQFIRKIKVVDPAAIVPPGVAAVIGTMAPSADGSRLFVQTSKSFQVVATEDGAVDYAYYNRHHHSCANHLLATGSRIWP